MNNQGNPHTHYHPKSTTWFTLDKCENCGGDVMEANAVTVSRDQQMQLVAMGVTIVDTQPAQGYYSDITEGETCDNCDPELNEEVN